MEKYLEILLECPLFTGIRKNELNTMVDCLGGRIVTVPKGTPIFLEGEPARYVGVVLSGTLQIVRDDYYGNRSVMSVLKPGDSFAEIFSCAGFDTMPASVIALAHSEALLLDCRCVITSCSHSCQFHTVLIKNLLRSMAQKNVELSNKIRYMSQKTTKEKLMCYLSDQAKYNNSNEFVIPHNRQSLADYLGVERSAMSVEISKLKTEGVLDTRGAWFRIK